jgi:1-acyl-sn-glycerol-3-phosphate acyltransferase
MPNTELTPERLSAPKPWVYRGGVLLTRLGSLPLGRIKCSGQENIPTISEPFIVAANHRSWVDPLILGTGMYETTGNHIHFLAAQYLWNIERKVGPVKLPFGKVIGKLMDGCGAIPVEQDKNITPTAAQQIDKVFQGGGILGIFPEGGVRHDYIRNLKHGASVMAATYGISILPIGIAGTELRPTSGERDFGNFQIHYGELLDVEASRNPGKAAIGHITPELRRRIETAYDTANELRQ